MKYSVIIAYRNREALRVQRVLKSLEDQTFSDFELIFVDYGSQQKASNESKKYIENLSFAQYHFYNSSGWFWNRAHALNIGIENASAERLLFTDIDLILPEDFLQKLDQLTFIDQFYTFSCYYLEQNTDYANLASIDYTQIKKNYVGLCAALKKDVIEAGCFNEYYMNWGGEDDDLYIRMEKKGMEMIRKEVEDFPVLHQWHVTKAPSSPNPWYLSMVNNLYMQQFTGAYKFLKHRNVLHMQERELVKRYNENGSFIEFDLFPNPLFQFNLFLDGFSKLASGDFCVLKYPQQVEPVRKKGRKQKLVETANRIASTYRLPYTIQATHENNEPVHTRKDFKDFVMYFIGENREHLQDYYFLDAAEKMELYIQKK